MSDGTTGIQVAPIPTESEMNRIRQIFEYAVSAIVRSSELAKVVAELEAKFATLNQDHTSVMARNDELVLSLNEVRLQRDQAQSELVTTKAERDKANQDILNAKSESDHYRSNLDRTLQELESVKNTQHVTEQAWMEATDRAEQAEAKLKAIHQTLGIPEPKPEPLAPKAEPQPLPSDPKLEEIIQGYPYGQPEPRPLTEPEATIPKYEWDPNKF